MQNIPLRFRDMPQCELFRLIRQLIYVAFAFTLWTVPVWTPDQLLLAVSFTAYCLLAQRRKEARLMSIYGERFSRLHVACAQHDLFKAKGWKKLLTDRAVCDDLTDHCEAMLSCGSTYRRAAAQT